MASAKVYRYIKQLRHPDKRRYALIVAYAHDKGLAIPDQWPGLTAMATQAVRWAIRDIIDGVETDA